MPPSNLPPIQLELTTLPLADAQVQALIINLPRPQSLISPSSLPKLHLPPNLDLTQGLIFYGQAPIWLYSTLIHRCHAAPWLGCYDARSGSVIVIHSRIVSPNIGDTLKLQPRRTACPAILIGGPPNSGKSVFANALRRSLIAQHPQRKHYLHRASWDGEGNWVYETANAGMVDELVRLNEFRIHEDPETAKLIPSYFKYHASAIANLRIFVDRLLVDVGGLPQPEKEPLVQQCSHYIIISRLPEEIDGWHRLCQPHLKPLTVIHSVLEPRLEILKTQPFLEIVAGPWLAGQTTHVPDCLLAAIDAELAPENR